MKELIVFALLLASLATSEDGFCSVDKSDCETKNSYSVKDNGVPVKWRDYLDKR